MSKHNCKIGKKYPEVARFEEKLKKSKMFEDFYNQCLWDAMPETTPGSGMKIGHLSCPCPKCRPTYSSIHV